MRITIFLIVLSFSAWSKNCGEVIKGILNQEADDMKAFVDEIDPSTKVKDFATFAKPSVLFKDNSVLSYNYEHRTTFDKGELKTHIKTFQALDKELNSRCEVPNENLRNNFPDISKDHPSLVKKEFDGSVEYFSTNVYDNVTREIPVNSKKVYVERSSTGSVKSIIANFEYLSDPNDTKSKKLKKAVKYEFNSKCELSGYRENDNTQGFLQNHSELVVDANICKQVELDDEALKKVVENNCSPSIRPMLDIGGARHNSKLIVGQCPSYAFGYKCPVDGKMTLEMPVYGLDKVKLSRVRSICNNNKFNTDSEKVSPKILDNKNKSIISF